MDKTNQQDASCFISKRIERECRVEKDASTNELVERCETIKSRYRTCRDSPPILLDQETETTHRPWHPHPTTHNLPTRLPLAATAEEAMASIDRWRQVWHGEMDTLKSWSDVLTRHILHGQEEDETHHVNASSDTKMNVRAFEESLVRQVGRTAHLMDRIVRALVQEGKEENKGGGE